MQLCDRWSLQPSSHRGHMYTSHISLLKAAAYIVAQIVGAVSAHIGVYHLLDGHWQPHFGNVSSTSDLACPHVLPLMSGC